MLPTIETTGEVTIVTVNVEEFDASNVDAFRKALAPVLKNCRKLVLDLSRVQFIDSRGCGGILFCLKGVTPNGGDLKLCGVNPNVRMTFNLIRMDSICTILGTRDEAVRAFQDSKPA